MIVTFTWAIPYPGIDHAGGEYVLRHTSALADRWPVLMVAENSAANDRGVDVRPRPDRVRVALVRPYNRWTVSQLAWRVRRKSTAITASRALADHIRHDVTLQQSLREAGVVEFQWTDTFGLARVVRRYAGKTPLVGIAHDVISQRQSRRVSALPLPEPVRRAYRRWIRVQERRVLSQLDVVITFSNKDASLVRQLAPGVVTEVLAPPVATASPARTGARPVGTPPVVAFVGALYRPENDEAVHWFLREVWPRVRRDAANAQFHISGAGPSADLGRRTTGRDDVVLWGYRDDLDEAYRQADVVVIPLLQGAGVKFKTITALSWGVPVVTTTVGAEGIPEAAEGAAIADDPAVFAEEVLRALRGGVEAERRAHVTDIVQERYSEAAFVRRLQELYDGLMRQASTGDHGD
ncbi:glycosyltransferase involved in cell wall biosynthesis [Geodermatophilus tzadiensis]|uniref:Glycosyltransferase involved in cell wall biosynthesis n=1 Tax=Geodermatophilus tzadiensis TaxID=1137988 RepID=A0A2T0ST55_9ACTN|nr:glycosyltransferase [Geodermatophilus tzadiensis]PRY36590.1 glycosyltransferase involved in cell wall biosynthesis [Geodermatophilus tzadiensis]